MMAGARLLCILASTLVFPLSDSTAIAATSPKGGVTVYENSARTAREKFSDTGMEGAEIIPRRQLPFQEKNALFGEEVGHIVSNCSTTQYRCVSVWLRVFAVPRDRLSPAAAYSVDGALLKVEDCLRGDASVCQVALISADCQQMSGESCEKIAGGREKSGKPGPVVYFIYNEDFGITAYGVTDQPAKSKDERLNVASQMILQGQNGLLSGDHS